ncbi:hypothetical protein O181_026883 [Austropuccinia psidii MF-1]|uniref:Uncharacterized protein n=1 Tax=Austropuccinia psidii MF-1 TaxID=1389203 RepID=A0A9Q3CQP0_9BASI|nr:hypothetical protein [Austropuccinia psidii MF-1]
MPTRLHPTPDETLTPPPHICPHRSLHFRDPASSSPLPTILMLLRGPQVMPPTPPSPAQNASNATYHPYASSALPTLLQHPPHTGLILMLLQPLQDETTMLPPICALTTPYASASPPFLLFCLQLLRSRGALKICP